MLNTLCRVSPGKPSNANYFHHSFFHPKATSNPSPANASAALSIQLGFSGVNVMLWWDMGGGEGVLDHTERVNLLYAS